VKKRFATIGAAVAVAFSLANEGAAQGGEASSYPAGRAFTTCMTDKVFAQFVDPSAGRLKTDDEIASNAVSQCQALIDPAFDEDAPHRTDVPRETAREVFVESLTLEAKTLSQMVRSRPARPRKK
jgi:hypothetical protein